MKIELNEVFPAIFYEYLGEKFVYLKLKACLCTDNQKDKMLSIEVSGL